MPMVDRLDELCMVCGRVAGDHTLREWAVCLATPGHDLPYEEAPTDVQALMRARFTGLDDYAIADNVTARAAVLDGSTGFVQVKVPALLLDCSIATPAGLQETAKVAVCGPPDVMRSLGRLLRDTANGAANAAERAG